MNFGPGPESYTGDNRMMRNVTIINVGDAGLTANQCKMIANATDHCPVELPNGEQIGSVTHIHFDEKLQAVRGSMTARRSWYDHDIHTEVHPSKSHIVKVAIP